MSTIQLQNLRKRLARAKARAFSLVELLVVIAVIGVIAAIAIPNIAGITGSAETARDERNAQQLVSVYSAAIAAGHAPAGDAAACAAEITTGGPLVVNGMTFHVPGLAGQDLTDAVANTTYNATTGLTYTP